VCGPVQDDEALLLFAVCRVACLRRIAEFGGQSDYSARNFLAAVRGMPDAIVHTVDPEPVPYLAPNHRLIRKWARDVRPEDFDHRPLDLVFFDCHDFPQQLAAFHTLADGGIITRATTLALHDTGTHPAQFAPWSYPGIGGFIHQPAERALVNALQDLGWESVSFHAPDPVPPLRYRHGLTFCRMKHRFSNEREARP
jgi:hypothetical protein